MRWLFITFFILLIHTELLACGDCCLRDPFVNEVTLPDPASYRITYTGFKGLLLDEFVRAVSRKWSDDIELRYNSGDINDFGLMESYRKLDYYRRDYFSGSYSDKRSMWWHYKTSWGQPIMTTTGPVGDLINIGPIRVNNKFKFKLKDYTTNLPGRWSYKFRPQVRVTTSLPLIRKISASNVFIYSRHGRKLVQISLGVGVNFIRIGAVIEAQLELTGW